MLKFKFWFKQFFILFLFVILTLALILIFLRNQVNDTIKFDIERKGTTLIKVIGEEIKNEDLIFLNERLQKYMLDSDLSGILIKDSGDKHLIELGSVEELKNLAYSNKIIDLKPRKLFVFTHKERRTTRRYL
ncbi:MAG TPA: hypothetical protein ENN73_06395 [Firmicutes bacterium]|nr:hypothetical protein [Bacillota bacterium]